MKWPTKKAVDGCYGRALHIGRVANQRGILVMGLEIVNFKE
jgi:hypothetical protein